MLSSGDATEENRGMVSVLMVLVAQSKTQIPPSLEGTAHHLSLGGVAQPCLPRQKKQKPQPPPPLLAARNPAQRLPLFRVWNLKGLSQSHHGRKKSPQNIHASLGPVNAMLVIL